VVRHEGLEEELEAEEEAQGVEVEAELARRMTERRSTKEILMPRWKSTRKL
jgi:hypothetical protein